MRLLCLKEPYCYYFLEFSFQMFNVSFQVVDTFVEHHTQFQHPDVLHRSVMYHTGVG